MTRERETSPRAEGADRPLFGFWATLGIGAALVVPFAVLTFTESEPYPAVILPGGGKIATHLDGTDARFQVLTFVGFDDDGTEHRLDQSDLLDPIPSSFAGGLTRTLFGQDTTPVSTFEVAKLGGILEVPRHVPDPEAGEAARAWLAERLAAAGVRPDRFEVHVEQVVVDHESGETIGRTVTERIVIL